MGIVNNFMGLETEILFADDVVGFAGQPLGVMVITFYWEVQFNLE